MGAESSKSSAHYSKPCRPSEVIRKPNVCKAGRSNNESNGSKPLTTPRIGHMIVASNSRTVPPCAPVNCAPRPIKSLPVEANLAWVAETEAALAVDWCTRRAASGGAGATGGGAAEAAPPATPEGKGVAQVTLCCPGAPFPANRSTGVIYPALALPAPAPGSTAENTNTTTATTNNAGSSLLPEIPVGEMYYEKLRLAWQQLPAKSTLPPMPPRAEKSDLDDSLILESIEGPMSCHFHPAIPLSYMIDLLVPEWEEEGLYDDAKSV